MALLLCRKNCNHWLFLCSPWMSYQYSICCLIEYYFRLFKFFFGCFRGRVNIFTLLYVDATIELELIPISKVNNCRSFFRTSSSGSSGLF